MFGWLHRVQITLGSFLLKVNLLCSYRPWFVRTFLFNLPHCNDVFLLKRARNVFYSIDLSLELRRCGQSLQACLVHLPLHWLWESWTKEILHQGRYEYRRLGRWRPRAIKEHGIRKLRSWQIVTSEFGYCIAQPNWQPESTRDGFLFPGRIYDFQTVG